MPAAPLPPQEKERLAALAELNLIGSEGNLSFDVLPLLASQVLETPAAAITLVAEEYQWFKASVGLDQDRNPRAHSICAHAILEPSKLLCIPDTLNDPRTFDNPEVTKDGGLRSYAGAVIAGPTGHPLGALCVVDTVPRTFSHEKLEQLRHMAVGVESAIKLHAAEEERQRRAMLDPLTGLKNRAAFQTRLEQQVAACKRDPDRRIVLISINLDDFSAINDLFGHAVGDLALQECAKRLTLALEPGEVAYRIGGDEFSAVVSLMPELVGPEIITHKIQSAFAQRFCFGEHVIPLRASVGAAVYPVDADNADDLVKCADIFLNAAKRSGGGAVVFAHSHLNGAMAVGRHQIRRELQAALIPPGREPFRLAFQPIVHAASGAVTGFEALVRWPQRGGAMMAPSEFIPAAEATGLIVQLDRWVIRRACRIASTIPSHLTVACNISAANFLSGDLVAEVCKALSEFSVEAHRLKLEITETILLRDTKRVRSIMLELRSLGVDVLLDDFGTGNASIAYLRDFPFTGVKIDRSFVTHLETDNRRRVFIKTIVDLARALDVTVTAEGVETAGQLRVLKRRGVDLVQGYFFGKPTDEDEFKKFIYESDIAETARRMLPSMSGPNLVETPDANAQVSAPGE